VSEQHENLEQVAMALYVYAAQLIKEGKSSEQVIEILKERGLTQEAAETIMTRLNESRDNVTKRGGYVQILFGAFVTVLGALPLFGVLVEQAEGLSTIIAILVMAIGIVIIGRGVLKVFFI